MAGTAGGKNKKYGRMSAWCKAYVSSGRMLKNKARRLLRQIRFANKKGSTDTQALADYKRITGRDYTA